MRSVTVQEAKTHLSRLLREVEAGGEVEIRRGNVPIAALSPRPAKPSFAELRDRFPGEFDADAFASADDEIAREFGTLG